ncbi:MAG: beta-lactamase family protein [Verrucomicrobia bacterium]|nr:MAG: beta-lactamase family protein [Verrucomicrobiota bacterium]
MHNPSRATMLPHIIRRPLLLATALGMTFAHAATPPPRLVAGLLQPLVDHHALAGAVILVADKDKILDVESVGFADIAAHQAMTEDSLFWIASMSKAMTAAALMILMDEGKVALGDPVDKYLPEFVGQAVSINPAAADAPSAKPVHPITIRNILSHTSGMAFSSPMESPTLDIHPLAERVRSYARMPLQFQPDSKYQYANSGINTAGRIIEVISGMSYEDFMKKRLFVPLGMKDTTFMPTAIQLTRLAKSYKANPAGTDLEETTVSQLKYPLDDRTRQPMPAGGLFSTAADTARFCQMLISGGSFQGQRILSQAAVAQMTSRQTPAGLPESYGLGLSINGDGYGHGGALSTNMNVDTKRGLITVFMVQNAGWRDEGNQALPIFNKAAVENFGHSP